MEKRNTDETEKGQINMERWFQVKKKLEISHRWASTFVLHFKILIQISYFSNTVESFCIYVNLSCF